MLNNLQYPFHESYPRKFFSKVRWKLNEIKSWVLPVLNFLRFRFTIIDGFGAPGDTLLTAIVAHNLKRHYPNLKLNIITSNPNLLQYDDTFETINQPESYYSERHWYLDILTDKDRQTNIIEPTLVKLGINEYQYKAKVVLSEDEKERSKMQLKEYSQPFIAINCLSKEVVKNWPLAYWKELVDELNPLGTIVQLGDEREPIIDGVVRFAGELSMRDSMALLSHCDLFIGPDSFLSHAANGVDVKSIIIFGGSRTIKNLGYKENINFENTPDCSPCWIHTSQGNLECQNNLRCLQDIHSSTVLSATQKILKNIANV
jgi:ADP-heptose:LPS heptosyltransferase|tara:strand:+ start:3476 stop:4423 length:948 start_codon:yes stop_codon:yes gene_type:complete